MKKIYTRNQMKPVILLLVSFLLISSNIYAQLLSFPGAEGYGKYTTGGRGGKVIEVTNLNDSGPGSLRDAVNQAGARTIVFRVSGTIYLNSTLNINYGNLTIAGQTAPGDGICLAGYTLTVNTDNVIIRYLRSRHGDLTPSEDDAMNGRNQKNIIIDHCSMTWSVDECASFYDNENFTMQWCIVGESLYHSIHEKGNHGYGGIEGGWGATFHHNLYVSNTSRNPRFCGARYHLDTPEKEIVDFVNNVIYNWGFNSIYGGELGQQNVRSNYFKSGPATDNDKKNRILNPSISTDPPAGLGKFYVADNYVEGYPNTTADNWTTGVQGITQLQKDQIKVDQPFPTAGFIAQSPEDAYQLVLDNAGAILPRRDSVDKRLISDTRSGIATYEGPTYKSGSSDITGIIDSQTDVGGWPELYTGPVPEDSDHDGMPDEWEDTHGLNKNDPEDRNGIGAGGYTNLEIYLNSITEFPSFLSSPTNVTAELTASTTVELNWEDNTEDETGFRVERAEGETGSFSTAGEVGANITTYSDTGLKELTHYRYRVIAFNDSMESGYEGIVEINTLSPTSLPLAVSNPTPTNGAVYVVTSPTLSWKASINAESYDVYFGTTNPPPIAGNQEGVSYKPGELEKGQKYYWRVDGVNVNGTTKGTVWGFTVKPEVPSGQITYWKFDETKGTTLTDAGAYHLDGTLMNMSSPGWTDGIKGGGLRFDGVDDYVLVPHSGIIDFGKESFSVSAWLKADPLTGASMYLINKGSFSEDSAAGTTGKWYGIEIKNNELRFAVDDNVTKTVATAFNVNTLLEEKWTHIVGIRDTTEGMVKLYVNGEMLSGVADATGNISEEEDMYIGNSTTGTAPLGGVLDEVRIYNYALSDAEVQAIYDELVDVEKTEEVLPEEFVLEQNYPNPFNPSTTIGYTIPYKTRVKIEVYDVLGKKIRTLVNEEKSAGRYELIFNAENLCSGVYLYQLSYSDKILSKKMLLIK
jgi:pectate lyase